MSPEAQRIAIAEACGWRHQQGQWWIDPNEAYTNCPLPDFLNDLNAMHEAEKVILGLPETIEGDATRKRYRNELEKASCKTWGDRIWHATAAQRAEAFLKTIGKWREENK